MSKRKQTRQIYLHLMVMLHQWLPTKEQHSCQKLNARSDGPLGFMLPFLLITSTSLEHPLIFSVPRRPLWRDPTVVFASVIFSQSFKMVQNIMVHVLGVSPASGPRVLPVAKVVAESLLSSSNGQAGIDFLEKLSLTIAVEVPGAHGDLDALPLRDLPLLPVNEEIQRNTFSESIYFNHAPSTRMSTLKCQL